MSTHIYKCIYSQAGQSPVNEATWTMFMNDCMWAVFQLDEESQKIKGIVMNHQSPKTQTFIETARISLEHLKNNALEFFGVSSFKGDLKFKKGKETSHFQSTTQTKKVIFRSPSACNQISIYAAVCAWFDQKKCIPQRSSSS